MDQIELLRFTIDVLERLSIQYAIVGSFASGVYGEPRQTHDIDIVVELKVDDVPQLCAAFSSDAFYVSEAAARAAVEHKRPFNIIHPGSGNKIDFMVIGTDEWSRQQIARSKRTTIAASQHCVVAAPEDVIIGKLVYFHEGGSEKHLRDITGMLRLSGELIDRDYVSQFAEKLGVTEEWNAVLKRLGERKDHGVAK